MKGKLMLPDGRDIEWSVDRLGTVSWCGGLHALRLPGGRPDVPQIEAALIGWHVGEVVGRETGRWLLQRDLRALIGCPK